MHSFQTPWAAALALRPEHPHNYPWLLKEITKLADLGPEPPEAVDGHFGPRAGAASEWSPAIKSNSETGRLGPESLQKIRTSVLAVWPERPRNGPPLLKVIAKLAGLSPGAS